MARNGYKVQESLRYSSLACWLLTADNSGYATIKPFLLHLSWFLFVIFLSNYI